MTNEDIIQMAREAGIPETATEGVFIANSDDFGRLIAAEREACAKVCEPQEKHDDPLTAFKIAEAIRARREQ